jgi:hypothetical protein
MAVFMKKQKIWDGISEKNCEVFVGKWKRNITEKSDYGRLKNGNGKRIEDPPQESKQTENRASNRKNVQNL